MIAGFVFLSLIYKQFWWWEHSAVLLGYLGSHVSVLLFVTYYPSPVKANLGGYIMFSHLILWYHILKRFWCWDCIFPSLLEAILVVGVFCCVPGPVVFICNCLLGCHVHLSWKAAMQGVSFSHILKQFWWWDLFLLSWSNSDDGSVLLCLWASWVYLYLFCGL